MSGRRFFVPKRPPSAVQMIFDLDRQRRAMMTTHLRRQHPDWPPERMQAEVGFRLLGKSDNLPPEYHVVAAMKRYERKRSEDRLQLAVQMVENSQINFGFVSHWSTLLGVEDVWQAVQRRVQKK